MGGALIIMALAAGTVLWCDLRSTLVWLALLVTVGYGAIGFVDDYLKLSQQEQEGPARQGQAARAVRHRRWWRWSGSTRRRAAARGRACGWRCRW